MNEQTIGSGAGVQGTWKVLPSRGLGGKGELSGNRLKKTGVFLHRGLFGEPGGGREFRLPGTLRDG
jgi:hypothetical protein